MALSDYLQKIIDEKNVSNAQFAKEMNINPTELSRILNHTTKKKVPSDKVLASLAAGLGISTDELIKICYEEEVLDNAIDPAHKAAVSNSSDSKLIYGTYCELIEKIDSLYIGSSLFTKDDLSAAIFGEAVLENDKEIYKSSMGTASTWSDLFGTYPETACFFYDPICQKIVGDWSFIALREDLLKVLQDPNATAEKLEEKMSIKNTFAPRYAGSYDLFILNMSFLNKYNRYENHQLLWETLLKQLTAYASCEIFINNLYIREITGIDWPTITGLQFEPLQNQADLYRLDVAKEVLKNSDSFFEDETDPEIITEMILKNSDSPWQKDKRFVNAYVKKKLEQKERK